MYIDLIVWDDDDDPDGNVRHIARHKLTPGDVDFVLSNRPGTHDRPDGHSRSSGLPLVFGDTPDGRRIVVVYEDESEEDLIIIKPKTAFPVGTDEDADS